MMLSNSRTNALLLIVTLTGSASVSGFAPPGTNIKSIKLTSAPYAITGKWNIGYPKSTQSMIVDTRLQSSNGDVDYSKMEPKVYDQRWIQLAYLSLLALLSDWICFAVAAAPYTYEAAYEGHSAASLIDIFLFTNVASCFLVTDTVKKFGLETAIKGASAVMAVGCFFRSGFGVFGGLLGALGVGATADPAAAAQVGADLVPFWSLLTGTIMVGAAQPFFQCTPPMLSATWFASDERATSTAIALNFNQIGIATAFLIGGEMATSPDGLANYFGVISVACALVTLGTFAQFQNEPPTPPSS
jgi:FLVCR family feline leukemia virus subgroup C receptor-related protein